MVLKDFKYAALHSHSTVYAHVVHIQNEDDKLSASLVSNRTSEQSSFHFIDKEVSLCFFLSFYLFYIMEIGWVTGL
jgi:hypothetical protein